MGLECSRAVLRVFHYVASTMGSHQTGKRQEQFAVFGKTTLVVVQRMGGGLGKLEAEISNKANPFIQTSTKSGPGRVTD